MRIDSVRFGFATNSSSSHSVVVLPGPVPLDSGIENCEFGWQTFVAASRDAKVSYLAVALHEATYNLAPEIADMVGMSLLGRRLSDLPVDADIDHESEPVIPAAFVGAGVDTAYVAALCNVFLTDGIVVLGGNDSDRDDSKHPLLSEATAKLRIPTDMPRQTVARHEGGPYWTLFSRRDGTKVRICLDPAVAPLVRSTVPELVDVKITNRCARQCKWCYQDSEPDALPADGYRIGMLARALGRLRVFEAAIGGGEPVEDPVFNRTLQDFRAAGVVPNFTTRRTAWLRDPVAMRAVYENCGGFALSVETPEQVAAFANLVCASGLLDESTRYDDRMGPVCPSVQYAMGTGDLYGVLSAAARYELPVTLLGFKSDGRGATFSIAASRQIKNDTESWPAVVEALHKEHRCPQIGIDTALARSSAAKLRAMGIPERLYEKEEGRFSCYIDATREPMVLRAASYGECPEIPLEADRYDDTGLAEVLRAGFVRIGETQTAGQEQSREQR